MTNVPRQLTARSLAAEAAFRVRIADLGGTVLGEYVNAHTPVLVRCATGHECSPRPGHTAEGIGICRICAAVARGRKRSAVAEAAFRARVEELGGEVLGEWQGASAPVACRCAAGHECNPWPTTVQQGGGICRRCAGKFWDTLYVVADDEAGTVKFGITSNGTRRIGRHARDGFERVIRLHTGLPGDLAPTVERAVLAALRDAREEPVRGREYFPARVLALVLDVVDSHLEPQPTA